MSKKAGYKKPPSEGSWKKGQSGNPRGRPKKDQSMTAALRKVLDEVPQVVIDGNTNRTKTWRELLMLGMVWGAYKGNQGFMKEIWAREEGMVPQPLVGQVDAPPIVVKYIHVGKEKEDKDGEG